MHDAQHIEFDNTVADHRDLAQTPQLRLSGMGWVYVSGSSPAEQSNTSLGLKLAAHIQPAKYQHAKGHTAECIHT